MHVLKATVWAALAALAAGCASPPKVATPTGAHRVPINNPAALAAYQTETSQLDAEIARRETLEREVKALRQKVAELRAYIQQNLPPRESTTSPPAAKAPAKAPALASSAPPVVYKAPEAASAAVLVKAAPNGPGAPADLVQERADAMVFSVTHPMGVVDFLPPASLEHRLLEAARAADRLVIHGHTDADARNAEDDRLARDRAWSAYRFLVDHGVPAKRIVVRWVGFGDFAVDNSTPNGKARNRRVDIEMFRGGAPVAKLT